MNILNFYFDFYSVSDCEKRFKNIKDMWRKAAILGRSYKYQKQLEFMLPFVTFTVRQQPKEEDGVQEEEDVLDEDNNNDYDDSMNNTMDAEFQSDMEEEEEETTTRVKVKREVEFTTAWDMPAAVGQACPAGTDQEEAAHHELEIRPGDQLSLFFSTMYSSVKCMQPRNALIVQKQIFDFVNEMQLREAGVDV